MSQPKDYDSTLARMAGNIASGMMGDILHSSLDDSDQRETIAIRSTRLAQAIVERCKKIQVDETP